MKIYRIAQKTPEVNWDEEDNYGVWSLRSVANFLNIQPDEYIYKEMIDINYLNPKIAEESHAGEIRDGNEFNEEAMDLYGEEANEVLKRYNESQFHDPSLEEWRDFLIYDYDEEDVLNLAKEMYARYSGDWEEEFNASGTSDSKYPPIVVTKKGPNEYIINDGNHRTRIWQEQGYDIAPAWVNDEFSRRNQEI